MFGGTPPTVAMHMVVLVVVTAATQHQAKARAAQECTDTPSWQKPMEVGASWLD